jgi:hypothetical protein
MATYKVIQDIEAEDKILGPLTLRQFIYAGVAAICLYLTYFMATHKAGFLALILLPVAGIAGFFAYPWRKDQPTEVWALARIRFLIKPRRRIWDQSGIKELVTVTAPKRQETSYTNGLSQDEVKSRLHALADTLDSRGWAIKNTNVNLYAQPPLIMHEPSTDRLLGLNDFPQQVAPVDIHAADDMLDEKNNPVAQQMDSMIAASTKAHRQKIMQSLEKPAQQEAPKAPRNDYWFLNQAGQSAQVPNNMVTFNTQVVTPGAPLSDTSAAPVLTDDTSTGEPDEKQLVEALEAKKRELPMAAYYGHLHTIQPLSVQQAQARMPQSPPISAPTDSPEINPGGAIPQPITSTPAQSPTTSTPPQTTPEPPVTPAKQAAILQLANNDDLNVATIAREAASRSGSLDGEVVIKLH